MSGRCPLLGARWPQGAPLTGAACTGYRKKDMLPPSSSSEGYGKGGGKEGERILLEGRDKCHFKEKSPLLCEADPCTLSCASNEGL